MVIIYIAPLVAIIGAFMYAISSNGKVQELGRIMFFCGLLVTLLLLAGGHVHIP